MRITGVSNLYGYTNSSALRRVGMTRTSGRNSGRNVTGSNNLDYRSNAANKINKTYDATKTAAQGLRSHAENLMGAGKDSLFARAQEKGNTEEIQKEVIKFAEQYNSMVKNMDEIGGTINGMYGQNLKDSFARNKEALGKAGITMGKDGTLSVDQEVLKKADLDSLKNAFAGTGTFIGDASVKSIYVEANAVSSQKTDSYFNNYNSTGRNLGQSGYGSQNSGLSGMFGGYGGMSSGMLGSLFNSMF